MEEISLQKQQQEKIEFLRKAYEVACNHSPSSPLSVDINPIELGKSIGFDTDAVRRIMEELVNDRLVTSTLGMGMLMVTQHGINYLRRVESESHLSVKNRLRNMLKRPTSDELLNNNRVIVEKERIEQLRQIKGSLDLTKLIRLCEELNDNYGSKNYYSVAMISRTMINHIPPIFGFETFNEVTNNYGGKSFKGNMEHLNKSMKNIADGFLHETIREKEILPNSTQVNFAQDLDVLLSEVIRKMMENPVLSNQPVKVKSPKENVNNPHLKFTSKLNVHPNAIPPFENLLSEAAFTITIDIHNTGPTLDTYKLEVAVPQLVRLFSRQIKQQQLKEFQGKTENEYTYFIFTNKAPLYQDDSNQFKINLDIAFHSFEAASTKPILLKLLWSSGKIEKSISLKDELKWNGRALTQQDFRQG